MTWIAIIQFLFITLNGLLRIYGKFIRMSILTHLPTILNYATMRKSIKKKSSHCPEEYEFFCVSFNMKRQRCFEKVSMLK